MPRHHPTNGKAFVLPNLFTAGSLFFGLSAIFYTFEKSMGGTDDPLKWACWFILIAAVLDALDGKIARMTRTESEFGVYFDSLADAVVFGVAPAMLMYSHLRLGKNLHLAEMSCIIYAICGVLRLARFNVQAMTEEHSHFTGLPIPGAAAMVVSCYLVATINDVPWMLAYVPFIMMALACLMVSRIRYFSLKGIDLETPQGFEVLVVVVMVAAALVALGAYKEWFIFFLTTAYVLSGPATAIKEGVSRAEDRARAAASAKEAEAEEREASKHARHGGKVREIGR